MMYISFNDIRSFFFDILEDFQDLGNADLFGLGFRVVLLFFGVIVFVLFLKFLWRVFWDVFGGVFRFAWWIISYPYVAPRDAWRRYSRKRRYQKQAKQDERQREAQRLQWEREKQEKEQREAEIFERIMKD